MLNVNFAVADVRPGWRVTIVNNIQLLHCVENTARHQLSSLTLLLCAGLQNVLQVTERDAFSTVVVLSVFKGLLS